MKSEILLHFYDAEEMFRLLVLIVNKTKQGVALRNNLKLIYLIIQHTSQARRSHPRLRLWRLVPVGVGQLAIS